MFPESWNPQVQKVQPVVKVRPETSFHNQLPEVAVSRRNNPYIHSKRRVRTYAHYLFLFKHPQKFYLKAFVDFTYFIEKNRACICKFKQPFFPSSCRPCKSSVCVAEKFAFKQLGRYGCAVYSNERGIPSAAGRMNALGEEFLSCTAFPFDKDCSIGRSVFRCNLYLSFE